jgi:hypothetical protein
MDQFQTVIYSVLLFIGPCAVVFFIVSFVQTKAFLRRSVEVSGEVVRLERSTDRSGGTTYIEYAPVFSLSAANGETYTVTSNLASSPADFSVGESVRVRYDPVDPQNARIHTFFQTWGAAVLSGIVGIGFIGVGCFRLGLLNRSW